MIRADKSRREAAFIGIRQKTSGLQIMLHELGVKFTK